MAVAQLVESRIVIPVVVGSNPISHPKIQRLRRGKIGNLLDVLRSFHRGPRRTRRHWDGVRVEDRLRVEVFLFIRGTQHNAPALSRTPKIVRGVKVPRFSATFTLNCPCDICHGKISALRNELIWLKVGLPVAICSIQSAQGDHVFGDWFTRLPYGKTPITDDARRDTIEVRDPVSITAPAATQNPPLMATSKSPI